MMNVLYTLEENHTMREMESYQKSWPNMESDSVPRQKTSLER